MSNAYAISAVSAVLQHYLYNALNGVGALWGSVIVSSKAPDIVQSSLASSTTTQNQVNLFLHQVTHNPGWRNAGLPSLGADGRTPLKNPPLALDLHYLLTAYGSEDCEAEALLGHALLMLHRFPAIARADITNALAMLPSPTFTNAFSVALGGSGLADQIEMIKITPSPLNREEMAWLWTALKADYRPTYPFQASVVLIEPESNLSFALPVLSRDITASAISPARVLRITPPAQQVSAVSGDQVTITGEFLDGASRVVLTNARQNVRLMSNAINVTATSVQFVVPPDAALAPCPAGGYTAAVEFDDPLGNVIQTTNALPFAVAAVLQLAPPPGVAATATQTTVTAIFSPVARPNQTVTLSIGNRTATATPFTAAANTLQFVFTPPLPLGKQLARLVVDGAPAQVSVNWPAAPGGTPTFNQATWVTI